MFQIYNEHKGFCKQIFLLAKNELIKTYKGAVIGPFWAVIKPAFTLFVYWFAFTCGIKELGAVDVTVNGEFINTFYRFTFMIVGFIPWFFNEPPVCHQGSLPCFYYRYFHFDGKTLCSLPACSFDVPLRYTYLRSWIQLI